jgi:hypothetical protein
MGTGCGCPAEITIVNRRHPLGSAHVEIDSTGIVRDEPETGTFPSQVSPTSPESLLSPWQLPDGDELRISQAYGPLDAMFHGRFSEDGDSFSGAWSPIRAQIRRPISPTRSAAAGSLDPAGPRARSSFPAPRAVCHTCADA